MKSESDNLKAEYNFDYSKAKPNRFAIKIEDATMSDLQKYIKERSADDTEFAQDFDEGFAKFMRDNRLRQARNKQD